MAKQFTNGEIGNIIDKHMAEHFGLPVKKLHADYVISTQSILVGDLRDTLRTIAHELDINFLELEFPSVAESESTTYGKIRRTFYEYLRGVKLEDVEEDTETVAPRAKPKAKRFTNGGSFANLERAANSYAKKGVVTDGDLALLIQACKDYEMLTSILVGTVISDPALNIKVGTMRLEDLQDRRKAR